MYVANWMEGTSPDARLVEHTIFGEIGLLRQALYS